VSAPRFRLRLVTDEQMQVGQFYLHGAQPFIGGVGEMTGKARAHQRWVKMWPALLEVQVGGEWHPVEVDASGLPGA
jgi:hypothetical protein